MKRKIDTPAEELERHEREERGRLREPSPDEFLSSLDQLEKEIKTTRSERRCFSTLSVLARLANYSLTLPQYQGKVVHCAEQWRSWYGIYKSVKPLKRAETIEDIMSWMRLLDAKVQDYRDMDGVELLQAATIRSNSGAENHSGPLRAMYSGLRNAVLLSEAAVAFGNAEGDTTLERCKTLAKNASDAVSKALNGEVRKPSSPTEENRE